MASSLSPKIVVGRHIEPVNKNQGFSQIYDSEFTHNSLISYMLREKVIKHSIDYKEIDRTKLSCKSSSFLTKQVAIFERIQVYRHF